MGYSVTKALRNVQIVMLPNVAGYANQISYRSEDLATKYPGAQLSDDDSEWFIGDLALSQLRAGEPLCRRGRSANENLLGNVFQLRIAKAALGRLLAVRRRCIALHVRIATGLPVNYMRDAGDLKLALIGQHRVKTDVADFLANVTDVMVMPQPYGTIGAPFNGMSDCA
jgi:hypothetical protein